MGTQPPPATTTNAPASTTAASTTALGATTCVATPDLNRGVKDSDCARCAEGYQHWPCNEAILCQCSGPVLLQEGEQSRRKLKLRNVQRHASQGQALVQASVELSRADGARSWDEL